MKIIVFKLCTIGILQKTTNLNAVFYEVQFEPLTWMKPVKTDCIKHKSLDFKGIKWSKTFTAILCDKNLSPISSWNNFTLSISSLVNNFSELVMRVIDGGEKETLFFLDSFFWLQF